MTMIRIDKTDIKAASKGWGWKEPSKRSRLIVILIFGIIAAIGEIMVLLYLPSNFFNQVNVGFTLFFIGIAGLMVVALKQKDHYRRLYEEKCDEARK